MIYTDKAAVQGVDLIGSSSTHFFRLWREFGIERIPSSIFMPLWRDLTKSKFVFQGLNRVKFLMNELEDVAFSGYLDPRDYDFCQIATAVWFCDYGYEPDLPQLPSSATTYFLRVANQVGLPDDFIEAVIKKIMLIRELPSSESLTLEQELVQDIGQLPFGLPSNKFYEWQNQIFIEEKLFGFAEPSIKEHAAYCRQLLQLDAIFQTPYFRELYEEQAQRNIRMTLSRVGCVIG